MRGRIIVMALAALLAIPAAGAWATVYNFSNTVDWNTAPAQAENGEVRMADQIGGIGNQANPFDFGYGHSLTFSPEAASIVGATLTLSHLGNNGSGEFWFLTGGTATHLGDLATSVNWVDQVFVIPSSLFPAFPAGEWQLQLRLTENTSGNDRIWLDKSVLSGTYDDGVAAVPEPASLTLMGLGLGALALRRRMRG